MAPGTPGRRLFFAGLLLLLGGAALWRLLAGDMPLSPAAVADILFSPSPDASPQEILVVRSVRLPRLLASLGAGASLAVSGAVLQGVLGNPLAEPYTLGIAAGAAFGASLAISLGGIWVSGAAFAGALAALGLALVLSRLSGRGSQLSMVLSGIVVSSVLSAG
ncbi:putative ABC transporter permease protein [bioreactor metagenome]|uniref:Putative ABC transporter permease protein n=2 Tax=root TaxID=1 RepID=A0A644WRI4_9ZZZZ